MGKRTSSKTDIKQKLAARIKQLREERGLTQEDLAEIMNSHASFVGALESGRKFPREETFDKLARSLKVPLHQLWMFEPEVSPRQRTLQELIDLLKDRPERETEILLSLEKELLKK